MDMDTSTCQIWLSHTQVHYIKYANKTRYIYSNIITVDETKLLSEKKKIQNISLDLVFRFKVKLVCLKTCCFYFLFLVQGFNYWPSIRQLY